MPKKNNSEGSYKYMYLTTAGICVAVAVVLVFFVMGLSRFAANNDESSQPVSETEESEAPVSEPSESSEEPSQTGAYKYYDQLEFEDFTFRNSDVLTGTLAVIDGSLGYPQVNDEDLVRISSVKTPQVYGLANTSLLLNGTAMSKFDAFIVSFYSSTPNNGLIISRGYTTPDAAGDDPKIIELATSYSLKLGIYNSSYKFSDDEFSYLKDQCFKYGIIRRYPEGKETYTGQEADYTIYRYVGLAHSDYMDYYNYSLEEYIDKLHTDKVVEFESRLEDGVTYVVYYVPADSGDTTEVPIPTDSVTYPYEISGDGTDGFIVTVKVSAK